MKKRIHPNHLQRIALVPGCPFEATPASYGAMAGFVPVTTPVTVTREVRDKQGNIRPRGKVVTEKRVTWQKETR